LDPAPFSVRHKFQARFLLDTVLAGIGLIPQRDPGVKLMVMTVDKDIILTTPKGRVRIRSFCSPEDIRRCVFDSQFAFHPQYTSLYTGRELLEKSAALPDANIVLALIAQNHIIGYGVLAYPDPDERWAELGPKAMMEVRAIEVCRGWRSCKIARAIIKMLIVKPQIEGKIIYLVGYSWTWDLQGTRKTAQQYREMLIELFKPHGFEEYRTNEPNVCLKPENIFMCRVGKNVPPLNRNRFKWLRFGLSPWSWNVDGR
jgi:acetoin utilization protein AcuA